MKTYKNIAALKTALLKGIAWQDYMKVGGKVFRLYEYGGGSMFHMSYDYIYFVNKKTHDAIYIKYDCPSFKWEKTGRIVKKKAERLNDSKHSYDNKGIEFVYVQTLEYRFIDMEYIPSMDLWRTDTL